MKQCMQSEYRRTICRSAKREADYFEQDQRKPAAGSKPSLPLYDIENEDVYEDNYSKHSGRKGRDKSHG